MIFYNPFILDIQLSLWLTLFDARGDILFPLSLVFLVIIIAVYSSKRSYQLFACDEEDAQSNQLAVTTAGVLINPAGETLLVYPGSSLDYSDTDLQSILIRRFSYFKTLSPADKQKFIRRLKIFIADKTFTIHDKTGFTEMPVLISACAVQLTFGLEQFLLPFFKYIHIYPAEFLGVYPTIRYLMGNVSGNTINIGWKYFLEGIENNSDGKNLGLHEMSHALYYQTFVVDEHEDSNFKKTFNNFSVAGDRVYNTNQEKQEGLYSTYALKNFQEFWAESVELYFEKPLALHAHYPELYHAMVQLLKQWTIEFSHLKK